MSHAEQLLEKYYIELNKKEFENNLKKAHELGIDVDKKIDCDLLHDFIYEGQAPKLEQKSRLAKCNETLQKYDAKPYSFRNLDHYEADDLIDLLEGNLEWATDNSDFRVIPFISTSDTKEYISKRSLTKSELDQITRECIKKALKYIKKEEYADDEEYSKEKIIYKLAKDAFEKC